MRIYTTAFIRLYKRVLSHIRYKLVYMIWGGEQYFEIGIELVFTINTIHYDSHSTINHGLNIYRWPTAQQSIYNQIISAGFLCICYLFKIRLCQLFIIDWGKYDRFLTGEVLLGAQKTQQSLDNHLNEQTTYQCVHIIYKLYIYVYAFIKES